MRVVEVLYCTQSRHVNFRYCHDNDVTDGDLGFDSAALACVFLFLACRYENDRNYSTIIITIT
jgi:hypothetical protein